MTLSYLPWNRPESAAAAERPCMRDERLDLSYEEFADRVEAVAEQFGEHGIGPGSVVALMLPNRVELLVALVAAWRLGAAATPVNPAFTVTEATYQIEDADAALIVAATDALAGVRPVLLVDGLRAVASGAGPAPHDVQPDDLALLIYTSGSTGRPKGVMLDHENIGAMAGSMTAALELDASAHCLLVLPLFHVNAICVSFLATIIAGGQLSILPRFHPVEFLQAVERLRPTYFSAVPTIYSHLLALPAALDVDTSSVRFAICGAAPASEQLLRGVEERFGFPILEGYGLTEGTCASTANPLAGPRRIGSVGTALPGQTVAIMGPDGRLMPAGERGEVVVRGPNVMRGYLGRPRDTEAALADGWLHTGDVGVLDEDGYLRLVDRIKDMIIRGGENLYPKEIENVLLGHPAVLEAAVVGAPDDAYGEVPVAFVALHPERSASEHDLLLQCREHLTRVKVPTVIHILASVPKNPVGKIDKPALRARLAERAVAHQGA